MDYTENIISFCTGYGGIELGLRLAGLHARTVCYVEIEAYAIANLVAKIEEGHMDSAPIWTDLKTFPAHTFRKKVSGIIGGYPCQPFSTAGRRAGEEDPRHLWPFIQRAIAAIRPRWCFFENVEGHLTLGFKNVCHDLGELGYELTAGLFSASEVGASHRRKRLFILGHSAGHGDTKLGSSHRGKNTTRKKGAKLFNEPSPELGDTTNIGYERCRESRKRRSQDSAKGCGMGLWPANPGQEQHDWEAPRTIESSMGCSIDGFNARVDQLRLLGNGVVPQTAALAWITLNKELNDS